MTRERRPRAIVYSCSGSSNVAQLANHLAVRLDRAGLAEMSCIVGVGGDVKPLVKKATSGAPIVLVDGCPLRCCEHVLAAKGIEPTRTIRLHERGLRKVQHTDFTQEERDEVYRDVLAEITRRCSDWTLRSLSSSRRSSRAPKRSPRLLAELMFPTVGCWKATAAPLTPA